jgi:RNA polymerase sigma-70 factor, ECF subfamily
MPREIQDPHDDAEEAYGRIELRAILSKVIGKLSPASQMLLALRYEQNKSTEATARLLGLSISAVKIRLLRARLAARKGLSEYSGIGPR